MVGRLIRRLNNWVLFQYLVIGLLIFTIAHSGLDITYQAALIIAIAFDCYLAYILWRASNYKNSAIASSHQFSTGEPIHLDFKCEHDMVIQSPPIMPDTERQAAIRQAKSVKCWMCDPYTWQVDEQEGTYKQLHIIAARVQKKIPTSYRGEY